MTSAPDDGPEVQLYIYVVLVAFNSSFLDDAVSMIQLDLGGQLAPTPPLLFGGGGIFYGINVKAHSLQPCDVYFRVPRSIPQKPDFQWMPDVNATWWLRVQSIRGQKWELPIMPQLLAAGVPQGDVCPLQ